MPGGACDERLAPATRDLLVGIAVLDHFSLTDVDVDHGDLVPRAIEIAARTDVALTARHLPARGGVGVAAATRVDRWTSCARALDHIDDVLALTRLTLPGAPRACCHGSTRRRRPGAAPPAGRRPRRAARSST